VIAVIGGGLAGCLLAEALRCEMPEAPVSLFDAGRECASNIPAALVHGFPGRTFRRVEYVRDAMDTTVQAIADWTSAGATRSVETSILRPLFETRGADRLLRSWRAEEGLLRTHFGARHLKRPEIERLNLPSEGVDEALLYGPALVVQPKSILAFLRSELEKDANVQFIHGSVQSLKHSRQGWTLTSSKGTLLADRVVFALGTGLEAFFPFLPLLKEGGEVLHVTDEDLPPLPMVMSAGGHIAPHPCGGWSVGATYWRSEELPNRRDEAAIDEISRNLGGIFPDLRRIDNASVWRGVRAIYHVDRMPLVGPIPGTEALFSMSTFGSKGLLWMPTSARLLAQEIAQQTPRIPGFLRADRTPLSHWHGKQIAEPLIVNTLGCPL
jgi:glycine/D-amino acid oxidase-like deaminating enzyme